MGLMVPLETTRRHRLTAGLGVGMGTLAVLPRKVCDDCEVGGGPMLLVPTLRYAYHGSGSVALGAGLRVLVPTAGATAGYAAAAVLSLELGHAPSP